MECRWIALAAVAFVIAAPAARAQLTPPVMPKTQNVPLPPAVVLPGPPVRDPNAPAKPLTADEAAAIALRVQPAIAASQAALDAARARKQQADSGLLPNLGVTAAYSRQQAVALEPGGATTTATSSTGSPVGYSGTATLRQLLFDFSHTRELVRQADALQRAAGAALTRAQSDTVLQVKQAFYTYVQNVRLVKVNESNLRNQQSHVDLAQARLKAGLGLPSDVVRAETAVAEAVLGLNTSQAAATTSRVGLALSMGIDPRTPIEAADSDEPAAPSDDVNGLTAAALKQRPEVVQARASLEASVHGLGSAKTSAGPTIGATSALSTRSTTFPPGNDFWAIGLSIQWSPFDSGLTDGRVREARANVTGARSALTSAEFGVVSDVAQAYVNLRAAERRVPTADAEVANAEESVRLAEGRYRSGLGTFIDVTDAQTALLTAQTNRVNVASAVDQARAALSRAIGAH